MITLQFVNAADPCSRLISWFSAGWFSHVDAVLATGDLLGARIDRAGAPAGGVQIRPAGYGLWTRRAVVRVQANERQVSTFYAFLRNQLGKPYDWRAICAFAFQRNWRARDAWFCSELQAAALECAGIFRVCPLVEQNKITPVALCQMVCALPGTTWEIN